MSRCANAHSDANPDPSPSADGHGHAYPNCNDDAFLDTDPHTNGLLDVDPNRHPYGDANGNTVAQLYGYCNTFDIANANPDPDTHGHAATLTNFIANGHALLNAD